LPCPRWIGRAADHRGRSGDHAFRHGRLADTDSHGGRGGGFLWRELSEGLPVSREPAYAVKRSHDGEAPAAFE
jgi:hypothetical protein